MLRYGVKVFFKWAIPGLFFLYFPIFDTVDSEYIYIFSPMTWIEPRTSGVRSNRSTKWDTTTALPNIWCERYFSNVYFTANWQLLYTCNTWPYTNIMYLFYHLEHFRVNTNRNTWLSIFSSSGYNANSVWIVIEPFFKWVQCWRWEWPSKLSCKTAVNILTIKAVMQQLLPW